MKSFPYNLKNDSENSDEFYRRLEHITDELYIKAEKEFGNYINSFIHYIDINSIEEIRFRNEYIIELIMIGVLWNRYINNARKSNAIVNRTAQFLYHLRRRNKTLKPSIDSVRGFIAGNFLIRSLKSKTKIELNNFIKLLEWLSATGEFREECIRFNTWLAYFHFIGDEDASKILKMTISYSKEFTKLAFKQLGDYTKDLNDYVEYQLTQNPDREDVILLRRREEEYHLNMICSQILNNAYRDDFKITSNKIILLPTCMRNTEIECKARFDGEHNICMKCSNKCNIGEIAKRFDARATTVLIPHSSDFTKYLKRWENSPDTALIGVACVMNLLTGGYEMRNLNIKSQCVFLDYSGCKNHWHEKGIPTELNLNQMNKILG